MKNMKRVFLISIGLCCLLTAGAQSSPAAKARVAEIRKLYTQAKQDIANSQKLAKEGTPANETVVNSNYMLPGSGPGKCTTHYYYTLQEDENLGRFFFTPYFITNSYNVAAHTYYQEFLYDKEGDLVFYYEKNNQSGKDEETRLYFGSEAQGAGEEGLVHEINSGSRTMEPAFANRVGNELTNAFHLLMNREF